MGKLFGTDGIRGVANVELTPELALAVGQAACACFGQHARIVVGKDTRVSGELLEAALCAGILSAGGDVLRAGVIPTPAVAYLVPYAGASAGAVISASHNPVEDNGIKFFGSDGFKLADELEDRIESALDTVGASRPQGADVGRVADLAESQERYAAHCLEALEGRRLDGMRIAIDAANGAAYHLAPYILERAGAKVIALNVEPDGTNINVDSGSTHPRAVASAVSAAVADAGFAFDGDADRVIAVDEKAQIVDGDSILAILAFELLERKALVHNKVVLTVMSNLGLRKALADRNIEVVETAVGDRYVIEEMRRTGAVLGGEQSGHIVAFPHCTTGDGIVTSLRLLARMLDTDKSLSELAGLVVRYPQVLVNVDTLGRPSVEQSLEVVEAVRRASAYLGSRGRVLVRASGTEPVMRIMVEASDQSTTDSVAAQLKEAVQVALNG